MCNNTNKYIKKDFWANQRLYTPFLYFEEKKIKHLTDKTL